MSVDTDTLGRMAFLDALHLALASSCKDKDELAAQIGIQPGILYRWLTAGDNYWPSVPMLPRICCAAGNDLLLQWVAAQIENMCLEYDNEPLSPDSLARRGQAITNGIRPIG